MVTNAKKILAAPHKRKLLGDYMLEDVHHFRINRHTFTIYITGDPTHGETHSDFDYGEPGVEYMMANRFEMNLNILSGIDPRRPILIVMASCGGDFEAGMQMFAAILACPNPVTILAVKWARSMTSIIPLAGDRFVIRPPAKFMYHHGTYGFGGTDQEAATHDVERRRKTELMMRLYVSRMKEQGKFSSWSEERIRKMLDEKLRQHIDVWFIADEAKEWGFADEVFAGNHDTLRAKKKNLARQKKMLEILRRPINVDVKIS